MSSLTSPNNASTFHTTKWLYARRKLRFFSRIRRLLLHVKASPKEYRPPDDDGVIGGGKREEGVVMERKAESDGGWAVLQKSVKKLHFGSWEEKEAAAMEIKTVAQQDLKRRKSMAELGVIPPLVSMFASQVAERRRLAVQALVELANGSYTNKALMVEAGLLSKFPEKMDISEESTRQEFVQLLLSITSLANAQLPAINTSRIVPFLVSILESSTNNDTIELCLSTLHNLSSVLENAGILVKNGVVSILLNLSSIKEVSDKALAVLGNLAVTLTGKKALEESPVMPESLIEIMTWEEKPKSQELSVYILMILAHQSSVEREKMAKAGIVAVLLEVALLGSALAQKRALKLLQWFKDERRSRMGPHSGPQMRRATTLGSPVHPREVDEGKRLMKSIVKQSLYKNMETITRRANGEGESSSAARLKAALVSSSSSKSLPY
ncbi:PREDICTED: U-box domain-containing protein 7-like [Ipomoea nil]|uniref:U-box domain-containing protein 7-like n=1 Tax=Ipomoea nil TaxID=35883 RepID=UPI000900B523|nr:PREDICTED: U-box domain-containing protein 7-like [Ipomoea nil]